LAPAEPAATQSLALLVKKERNYKKAVDRWVWHGFNNPARQDPLVLHHWTKAKETDEVYPFAKFNRKVEVIRYTDQEYAKAMDLLNSRPHGKVANTDWSKEETDHLFDLCEQFSLRFIVIADRFGLNSPPT
jgi:DNA methyltransferase 1-associated protein 1